MTYNEYINNPQETKLGAYTRDLYRISYKERFNKILLRENNNIEYYLYKNDNNGSYYMYIKIPSEKVKEIKYDVIVHYIRPLDDPHKVDTQDDLYDYDVQFFSNDPSFVYNTLYTFNDKNMFIKDYISKTSNMALHNKPVHTNPNNIIQYCKSLYFAYIFAKQRGLFLKNKYIEKYDKKRIVNMIQDTEPLIEKRQILGVEKDKKEKLEKKKNIVNNSIKGIRYTEKILSNPDFNVPFHKDNKIKHTNIPNFNIERKINWNKS